MSVEKKKVVFLDRDGVLCEDTDYVTDFQKLKIFPFAKEAVEIIHRKGYLAIVVTNQSAVARGMMSEETLLEINRYLQEETGVDSIYYCPHLPPEKEEILPYRIRCNCRKPGTGMLLQAARDYPVEMKGSYMVGDRESDLETGRRAGILPVLISEKAGETQSFSTVLEFAKWL